MNEEDANYELDLQDDADEDEDDADAIRKVRNLMRKRGGK